MHKERSVGEDSRSLEERLAGVTSREGRVQGLEALKVQMDADKAAMEQRRLHLENTETQVSSDSSLWPYQTCSSSWTMLRHKSKLSRRDAKLAAALEACLGEFR